MAILRTYGAYFAVAVLFFPGIGNAATEATMSESLLQELRALVSYLEHELGIIETSPLSHDEMREIIVNGTSFLVHAQEENGHFRYEYVPYEDTYRDDDNIVRQAGALYQLGEVARRDAAGALELKDAMESSIAYFEELSREDSYDGVTFRCIVEHETSRRCKLGATSLALIGVLSYVEAYPEEKSAYEDLIEDYIAYIKASDIADGGFRNVHRVGRESQSEQESSFSNGEALLTLARYYAYDEDVEAAALAQETFEYLRSTPYDTPLYLWIMAALKDMQHHFPDDAYAEYARDYTKWRIDGVAPYKGTDHNYCAYAEGLTSAYSVLEQSSSDVERTQLRNEIDFWNQKNSTLQLRSDAPFRFVYRDDALTSLATKDMDNAAGGFLTGYDALTERIDFTQHCISSYLQVLVDIDNAKI